MKKIALHDIRKVVKLLDSRHLVYIHLETGKIIGIPEFDDFIDFVDDESQIYYSEIETHPNEYYQIQPLSSRETFNLMMDFAQEQEEMDVTNELVRALRKSNAIVEFKRKLNQLNSSVKRNWITFQEEKTIQHIRNKLWRKKRVYGH